MSLPEVNNDPLKAEKWLEKQGYKGHAAGVTVDSQGNQAIAYANPEESKKNGADFGTLWGAAWGKDWDKQGANFVHKTGDPGSNMPEKTYPDPTPGSQIASNVRHDLPDLWKKINETFTGADGKIDAKARDDYLAALCGNDELTPDDVSQLNQRFGDRPNNKAINNRADFERNMEKDARSIIGTTGGWGVTMMLDNHGNKPYVLDQLFTRFDANKDGKLDKAETEGLNQYVKGRVTFDDDYLAAQESRSVDWSRLEGKGARPKQKAVEELIADPTVINRMPSGSFDGAWTGSNRHIDAYMDDEGGYLDVGWG